MTRERARMPTEQEVSRSERLADKARRLRVDMKLGRLIDDGMINKILGLEKQLKADAEKNRKVREHQEQHLSKGGNE